MRKRGAVLGGWVMGVALLAGCGEAGPAAPAARPPLYFDVRGLLTRQVAQLEQRHAAVTKHASLRGNAAETVRVPAVKWSDELQIFFQADINKAALRGAYTVDSVVLPGGLLRRIYTRRPGQSNAPVSRLTVVSAGPEAQGLEASIEQHNPLFETAKELKMSFQQNKLRHYEVRGSQKLVLFNTLHYAASGEVE